jgi:repressor of nif and glnA expression
MNNKQRLYAKGDRIMRADIQNLFIRIHMLHDATERDLNVGETLLDLERRGYRIGEREVKLELEKLTEDNFLTLHGDIYSITGAGLEELKEIQLVLAELCKAVLAPEKPLQAAAKAGK